MVITPHTVEAVSKVLKRKPVIWDNIHANDYDQRRVFLGPYDGRPVQLYQNVSGVLTNPNCEYESNFVAVHTLASWIRCAKDAADVEPMALDPQSGDKAAATPSAEPMEEDAGETAMQNENSSQTEKIDEQDTEKDSANVKGRVTSEPLMETESIRSLLESKTGQVQGLYDPQAALQDAVTAWLKEFSKEKKASSRLYAKSGPYSVVTESLPAQAQSALPSGTTTTNTVGTVCAPATHVSPVRTAKENSRKQQTSSPASGNSNVYQ